MYGDSSSCGGDSSGGYGGGDTSSGGMGSETSSTGYGGDSSSGGYGGDTSSSGMSGDTASSSYGGDSSSSSSDTNTGSYGGIAGAGADYSGAANSYSGNEQGIAGDPSSTTANNDQSTNVSSNVTMGDNPTSTINSDSATGSIAGAGADFSGAVQNSYAETNGAVPDNSSTFTSSLANNNYSGLGLLGGEPCTDESLASIGNYSIANYSEGLYTDNTSIQSFETTLDTIQNTVSNVWDGVTSWADQNIAQPVQAALNQHVEAPESDSVSSLLSDNVPGMTKEEVENGLSAMGVTSTNETQPSSMIGDDPEAIGNWAAANGIQPTEVTQTETAKLGDLLNQAINWDNANANPMKNLVLNSGDAGVAQGIDSLKDVTIGKVSVSALGPAAELEVAEKSIGVSALKGISKFTGPLNIVSTGYDVYNDSQNYEGKQLAIAVTADLAGYGVGIGTAAVCVVLGAPVVTGVATCTVAAITATYGVNYIKGMLSAKSTQ